MSAQQHLSGARIMTRKRQLLVVAVASIVFVGEAAGRGGFGGGFRGGGFRGGFGGSRSFGYGGGGFGHGFSGYSGESRFGGGYSGSRSLEGYSNWGGRGLEDSYSRTYDTARGGSISTSGTRGAAEGLFGGFGAGGTRDTSVETAGGRSFSGSRDWGVAGGPGGRTIGGEAGSLSGPRGTNSWESAFAGNRYTGNLSHYASAYGANGAHSTAYWSNNHMAARAGDIRSGFGYYGAFNGNWYTSHPGAWFASGWAAGAAWATPNYGALCGYWGWPVADADSDYDYGTTVVYTGDNVYVNGQDQGSTTQYAQQATDIAAQGQAAAPPPSDEWKPMGVFALVQGSETTSNNVFQLAVDKNGVVRGNYYDGLMDANTEVYGSVDKKTRRACWTIGKKKDRVFEAGAYNLTQDQCPCLVHIGTTQTNQMLLVRMQQPGGGAPAAAP